MTIDELLDLIPKEAGPEVRTAVAQYGPTLLAGGLDVFWQWVELMLKGDTRAAYETVVSRMTPQERLAEAERHQERLRKAVNANADFVAYQREAMMATLRGLAGALIGLLLA